MWREAVRQQILSTTYKYGSEVNIDDVKDDAPAKQVLPTNLYRNNLKSPSTNFKDLPSKKKSDWETYGPESWHELIPFHALMKNCRRDNNYDLVDHAWKSEFLQANLVP